MKLTSIFSNFPFFKVLIIFSFLLEIKFSYCEYGSQSNNYVLGGLNSSTSYVSIPSNTAFNATTAGTIEMWIYVSPTIARSTFISKGSTAAQSFLWALDNNTHQMHFQIGNTFYNNSNGNTISSNVWTHIAVTWANGPNYTVTFYVNGQMSGSVLTASATWNTNTDPIRIGASQYNVNDYFQGRIDEVRFWNVTRSAAEITNNRFVGLGDGNNANYNNALTASTHYSGLVASWTFNTVGLAYDNIGGFNGTYNGSANSQYDDLGVPIPYNLALLLSGGQYDYVRVPDNSSLNLTNSGTIEMWYKPTSISSNRYLIAKGSIPSTVSFLFGITSTGELLFRTASDVVTSNGPTVTVGVWNHIAVTYATNGSVFNINFYLNGQPNGTTQTLPAVFPVNSDFLSIGGAQLFPSNSGIGWLDEVRIWSGARSAFLISNNMFVSGRSLLPDNSLIGLWNFDGNLNNFSSVGSGINGSFNNGGTNNCRLSAYTNETSTGAYSQYFISHSTVINRLGNPSPFPWNYFMHATNLQILDGVSNGVLDTIYITSPTGLVSSVEAFVSIQHNSISDIVATIRAPNGQVGYILNQNGFSGKNVLSFFGDGFTYDETSTLYYPPWGQVKPNTSFGSFNSSTIQGAWIIEVADVVQNSIGGIFEGWGLRFNNAVNIEKINKSVPAAFKLYQNYPNPFNPSTNIKVDLANDVNLKIVLYDILGREVKSIVNDFKEAGSYNLTFDASSLSSGTYFYRIEANAVSGKGMSFIDTKKMTVIK